MGEQAVGVVVFVVVVAGGLLAFAGGEALGREAVLLVVGRVDVALDAVEAGLALEDRAAEAVELDDVVAGALGFGFATSRTGASWGA
ncbi:MAG: hypothetical protein HC882_08230, partial [Acidobacteria bacterium]|nr:hypothetical protein [Acidobacteriota bacterium]